MPAYCVFKKTSVEAIASIAPSPHPFRNLLWKRKEKKKKNLPRAKVPPTSSLKLLFLPDLLRSSSCSLTLFSDSHEDNDISFLPSFLKHSSFAMISAFLIITSHVLLSSFLAFIMGYIPYPHFFCVFFLIFILHGYL